MYATARTSAVMARFRLASSAAGAEKSTSTSPLSWSIAKAGSSATAVAIAFPILPLGAMRLMRIGWSAALMRDG